MNALVPSAVAVPTAKRAALKQLTQAPPLAWPTIIVFLVALTANIVVDAAAVMGGISYPLAAVLVVVCQYPLFGVGHDATHRALSSNASLNDWIGRFALALFVPQASLGLFRWAHMQHHRFTNGERDPDRWIHGRWWTALFRWATFDIAYLVFIATKGDRIAHKHLRNSVIATIVTIVVATALWMAGYWEAVVFLWLIPSRVTMMIFAAVFFWLPHVKHDVTEQQNPTLATSIRLGHEWFLNPLLQFHNYHLIHHLWPSTPPYRHSAVWALMETELRQRHLLIQRGFHIQPEVVPGRQMGASG